MTDKIETSRAKEAFLQKKRFLQNRCVAGTKIMAEFSPDEFRAATVLKVKTTQGGLNEYAVRWEHKPDLCTDMLGGTNTNALQEMNCIRPASRTYLAYGTAEGIRCDGFIANTSINYVNKNENNKSDGFPGAAIVVLLTFGIVFLIFWAISKSLSTNSSGAGTDARSQIPRIASEKDDIWDQSDKSSGKIAPKKVAHQSRRIAPENNTRQSSVKNVCGINFVESPTSGRLHAQLSPTREEIARRSRVEEDDRYKQTKQQGARVTYAQLLMMTEAQNEGRMMMTTEAQNNLGSKNTTPRTGIENNSCRGTSSTAPSSRGNSRTGSKQRP